MFPDTMTWDEWVLAGNDSISIWADPRFLDPASGQYLLRENSPAGTWGLIRLDRTTLGFRVQSSQNSLYGQRKESIRCINTMDTNLTIKGDYAVFIWDLIYLFNIN